MHNDSNSLDFENSAVVLISRGGISPPYLNWWRNKSKKIYILDFSRWRWFAHNKEPQWIYPSYPPKEEKLIVFDRSISTGMTMKYLKGYLTKQGYSVTCIGVLDKNHSYLGLRYLDYIWEKGNILKASDVKSEVLPNYTLAVLKDKIPHLGGIDYTSDFLSLQENPLDTIIPKDKSVVIQMVPSWMEGMLISYIVEKPLILIVPDTVKENGDITESEIDSIISLLNV